MVRVLVVDDEKEIRNGLVHHIPWSEWGVRHVDAADDGDSALELATRLGPELIVTDIRMPRMSGLELIAGLSRTGYTGDVIVISGYDDFHFAKEAFKLGVSDYLLKPINKQELGRAVAAALERRRERSERDRDETVLRQSLVQVIPKLREETMRELVERSYREDVGGRTERKLRQAGLDWLAKEPLRLAVFGIDNLKALTEGKPPGEKELVLFAVGNVLDHLFKEEVPFYVLFRSSLDHWVAVFGDPADGDGRPDDWAGTTLAAAERAGQYAKVGVSVGMAPEPGTMQQLYPMHRRAVESLDYHKIYKGIAASEEHTDYLEKNGELVLASPKQLTELLLYGTERDIRAAMEHYPNWAKSRDVHDPKDLQQLTFEWLLETFRTAQKLGWKETSWEKNPIAIWEQLERFDTLESLQREATARLLQASESMQEQLAPRSQIVHAAERWIERNYGDMLTLQTVADQVHVTPVWLSKLFKKETGMSFLEYVTGVRLRKATELLMDLNLKVYQISYLVGYQDPVHFSRLFKKKYGCTPHEYRNKRGNHLE
ncbi:response regulator transcription factor [Paenibacillus flagellatus]|uniref:DNA-binding response regulator n=1 Tax=Paenibacillus flagellatus TaxID=2211139 RepID=A0A2V5K561_9BACL|nr:response regulator [Paenibacillus flagellatus]PYI54378.1 DNA-binding response regulator [Paenibacillus flagellatus]